MSNVVLCATAMTCWPSTGVSRLVSSDSMSANVAALATSVSESWWIAWEVGSIGVGGRTGMDQALWFSVQSG